MPGNRENTKKEEVREVGMGAGEIEFKNRHCRDRKTVIRTTRLRNRQEERMERQTHGGLKGVSESNESAEAASLSQKSRSG